MNAAGILLLLTGALWAQVPGLPEKLTGRVIITGITFAEGPAFDAAGNLYFVNYQRNGTIGRMAPGAAPVVWVELPKGANAFGLKVDRGGNVWAADFNT